MTECLCPVCKQPIDNPLLALTGLAEIRLGHVERDIVLILARNYPRYVTRTAVMDYVYRNDPNGGPVMAPNVISAVVTRLRGKLVPHGWTIPKARTGQGSEGYRLVPVEP